MAGVTTPGVEVESVPAGEVSALEAVGEESSPEEVAGNEPVGVGNESEEVESAPATGEESSPDEVAAK